MSDNVWFATVNKDDGTAAENKEVTSGFNGFPFGVVKAKAWGEVWAFSELDESGNPFSDPRKIVSGWNDGYFDDATFVQGEDKGPIVGSGTSWIGPFTREEVVLLYWRAKSWEVSAPLSFSADAKFLSGQIGDPIGDPSGDWITWDDATVEGTANPSTTEASDISATEKDLCMVFVASDQKIFENYLHSEKVLTPITGANGAYVAYSSTDPDNAWGWALRGFAATSRFTENMAYAFQVAEIWDTGTDLPSADAQRYYVFVPGTILTMSSIGSIAGNAAWGDRSKSILVGFDSAYGTWGGATYASPTYEWVLPGSTAYMEGGTFLDQDEWTIYGVSVKFQLPGRDVSISAQASSRLYGSATYSGILDDLHASCSIDGDITVKPYRYWPYENSQGQPVWDTETGNEINPPTS